MDGSFPLGSRLNICIVTDAWHPQVNGVVRTLDNLRQQLENKGHLVSMLTPRLFRTLPCPTYPEIRLSLNATRRSAKLLESLRLDAVHIATEGPLGWAARRWCIRNNIAFTTAYHTAFPEYIAARSPFPASWFYPMFRRFHAASAGVLVATETIRQQLKEQGFTNIVPWTRGVDTSLFKPRRLSPSLPALDMLPKPLQLYVGRVAVEKNIEAFLATSVPGTKLVVGDGPALGKLKVKYPSAQFLGAKFGEELAAFYAAADVFVFPSKTDTFGLVMIEALAAGTPVAAYPVQGPLDVVGADGCGPFDNWTKPVAALDQDLNRAIDIALTLDRGDCSRFAGQYDWQTVADQFINALRLNAFQPSIPSKHDTASLAAQ